MRNFKTRANGRSTPPAQPSTAGTHSPDQFGAMAVRNGGKLSIIGDYVGLADKITVSLDQVPKMYDLWNKKEEGAIKVTWKP